MGSGDRCAGRLSAVVDDDYLEAKGFDIRERVAAASALGGAIDEVCEEGPPSLTVEQGAERVVEVLRESSTPG